MQLADGVEQCRHPPPFLGRQRAVSADQILDQPALALVADRQAVAGVQAAFLQVMLLQGAKDRASQFLHLLPLTLQLRLDVEHVSAGLHDNGMNVGQQLFQPFAVRVERLGQRGEAGRLSLGQAVQLRVGQTLKQLAIALDFALEEVVDGRGQHRRPVGRP